MELRLPARPESVTAARHAIRRFAEELHVPPSTVDDLMLAVGEACANVVVHAYDPSEPGMFELIATADDGVVTVTVRDWGRGMMLRSDSPGLGLGLPLIARLSTSVEIRGAEGRGAEVQMRMPMAGVGHSDPRRHTLRSAA